MAKVKDLEPVAHEIVVIAHTPENLRTPEQREKWEYALRTWTAEGETSYLELPPFRAFQMCVKCGGEEIASGYHRVTCIEAELACYRRFASHEHMHRVCTTCKYAWFELPLDASS